MNYELGSGEWGVGIMNYELKIGEWGVGSGKWEVGKWGNGGIQLKPENPKTLTPFRTFGK